METPAACQRECLSTHLPQPALSTSETRHSTSPTTPHHNTTMADIRFRVRGPGWVETVTATPGWTIQELIDHLREKQGVEPAALKYGWPLKTIDLSDVSATIEPLNLKGEAITFVPKEQEPSPPPAPAVPVATKPAFQPKKVEPDASVLEWPEKDGFLGTIPSRSAPPRQKSP